MEQIKVIRGFSDIKIQLIKRCNLKKTPQELELWFTEDEHATYVHDKDDHNANMLIALENNQNWVSRLIPNSMGDKTLNYFINQLNRKNETLSSKLNFEYGLSGFFTQS